MPMPNKEKKIKILSQRQYVKRSGNLCPFCHSHNIEGNGSIQSDADYVWQNITCLDCHKTWQDLYKLVGYDTSH